MSRFPHRYTICVPETSLQQATELFVALGGESQRETFSGRGYSANGSLPATHFLVSSQATESHRELLEGLEQNGQLPAGLVYFRTDSVTNELMRTNHGELQSRVGETLSAVQIVLLLGLVQVREEVQE